MPRKNGKRKKCKNCGKIFFCYGDYRKYKQMHCSISCSAFTRFKKFGHPMKGKKREGEIHKRWKNGRVIHKRTGYVYIRMPKHPTNQNGYVLEHRLVMEKSLGRLLNSWEVIHHINGKRFDNRLKNLELYTYPRKQPPGHQIICPNCNYNLTKNI